MMRKVIGLGFALILSFVFYSVSEAVNLKKGIIGKWYFMGVLEEVPKDIKALEYILEISGATKDPQWVRHLVGEIEFVKDGTFINIGVIRTEVGSYKFIDDNRLKIVGDARVLGVFEVSIDKEGTLILTESTGKVMKLFTKAEMEKRVAEVERRMAIQRAEEEKRLKLIKLRFKDNGDGTVTDNQTGLMWTKDANPLGYSYSFDWAPKGIAKMNTGEDPSSHPNFGYKDWRLPSNEELGSLLTTLSEYYSYENFENFIPLTNLKKHYTFSCYYTKTGALNKTGRETDYGLGASCGILPVRGDVASSSAPSQDLTSKDENLQKLKVFIADQWKQVIQIPEPKRNWKELVPLAVWGKYDDYSTLYLMGLNRRSLANDALVSADKFLKKDDLANAKKYAGLATRHYIDSNELFNASEQVFSGVEMTAQTLEAMYRGPKEASKYGWFLMCGPKCYEVADYVFLMTDFAMDYGLEGMDEAKKNLIVNAFVKTLLKTSGVSKWIENRTTHLIGDSGLYGLMDKTLNSPEFQKTFMEVLAESGAYTTQKMVKEGGKKIIRNSLAFIKASSNLKPAN